MKFSTEDEQKLYCAIRSQVKSAMHDHPADFPGNFADSVAKRVFGQLTKGNAKELLRKVASATAAKQP